ncbi:TPA: 5-formyltetrahydrofolate cyclo-ligase, partial [Candidatus Gracilibacteria bacterium]|nr:5-formyltetrahydrofolate cyclo-ligase [Candidatus Gracilibacteria bacterium]
DQNKNRIGMGAGFYDGYFNKYFTIHNKKNSTIICTIFSEQISKTLFTEFIEKFDIPADTVVTEK